MSEMDDFAALNQSEYRAFYGAADLGPFIADPVIRINARRLALPVYDENTGNEYSLLGHQQQQAEIELSLRDGLKALDKAASAANGYVVLKFTSIEPGAKELTFPHVHAIPKVQFIPSAKSGHRAVLTFYATPGSDGKLFTWLAPATSN